MRNRKTCNSIVSEAQTFNWRVVYGEDWDSAFIKLRHNLAVKFGWSEDNIYYRDDNGKYVIYHENTKFVFKAMLDNRTKNHILQIDD